MTCGMMTCEMTNLEIELVSWCFEPSPLNTLYHFQQPLLRTLLPKTFSHSKAESKKKKKKFYVRHLRRT